MAAIVLALIVVAAVLAGIELFRTRGQDLVAWAALALAVALLIGRL